LLFFSSVTVTYPVSLMLAVSAGVRSWQHGQPTGVTDIPGPRRAEGCSSAQNASTATGKPYHLHTLTQDISYKTKKKKLLKIILYCFSHIDKFSLIYWRSLGGEGHQLLNSRSLYHNHHSNPGHSHQQGSWRVCICAARGDSLQAGEGKPYSG